jgi:sec-independent protein translocase protein TatA
MFDNSLNIVGSEWIIIIFVALVLILGTNQLPGAAKKLGKAVNEYNRAKNDVQNHMKDITNHNLDVSGPVENERQKIEMIAKSLGVRVEEKSDDELRKIISNKIGQKKIDEFEKKTES